MAPVTPLYRCRCCNAVYPDAPILVPNAPAVIRDLASGHSRKGLTRVVIHRCSDRTEGLAELVGVEYEPETPAAPAPAPEPAG